MPLLIVALAIGFATFVAPALVRAGKRTQNHNARPLWRVDSRTQIQSSRNIGASTRADAATQARRRGVVVQYINAIAHDEA